MRLLVVLAACAALQAGADDVSRFDPRIAADVEVASAEGLVWFDGESLQLESKAFADCKGPYGRLPVDQQDGLSDGTRAMGRQATGHYFLFQTASDRLGVRWNLESRTGTDPYIPPQGMYGVDIYQRIDGRWRFLKNGRLKKLGDGANDGWEQTSVSLEGTGDKPVMVYLPTRAVVRSVRLGVQKGAKLSAWRHPSGVGKPVVHYGTSIVHGGCASRPGLCFSNIAGREADVPYVNLGFSGQARLDLAMAKVLGRADASLYLVDPVWNCNPKLVHERLEPFLRTLHALRPNVKILVCEGIEPRGRRLPTNDALKAEYDRLVAGDAELAQALLYLPAEGLIQADGESTHDYCHPNDYGSVTMGHAFARAVRQALKLK